MLECNGELVNVSKAISYSQAFLWWTLPHVGCVWCVWWGCLERECFFDVLDNDGEAL